MTQASAPAPRKRGDLSQRLILETAISLFTERGYDRTSMNDIAATLGITKPALYYYFRGKEEIFVAAIEGATDCIDQALADACFESLPRAQRVSLYIQCYSEALAHPLFRGLALADERVLGPSAQDATRLGKRHSVKRLRGYLEDAGIATDQSRPLALAIFGALNWAASTFGERSGTELAEVTRTMIDLVHRLISAKPQSH